MTFRLHMTLHSLSVFKGQYRHSSSVYCKTWTKKNSLYINMQIKYALSVSVHVEDFISSLAHSSFYQFTQKNTITFKNTRRVPVTGCNVSRYHKLEVFVAAKLGCVYSKQGRLVGMSDQKTWDLLTLLLISPSLGLNDSRKNKEHGTSDWRALLSN